MLYVVRVDSPAGQWWIGRGELVEYERATRYDSPSAAYRAARAFHDMHGKRGQVVTVLNERELRERKSQG